MTKKTMQARIAELETKIEEMPKVKICSECHTVKGLDRFSLKYPYSSRLCDKLVDYCNDCEPVVEEREIAIRYAERNPKKVIKLMGSWW